MIGLFCLSLTLAVSSPLRTAAATAKHCVYRFDPSAATVGWTAFKTTAKVGVNGTFPKFMITGKNEAPTLAQGLAGLKIDIDASTVETGNPARDATIAGLFFGNLKNAKGARSDGVHILGTIAHARAADKDGSEADGQGTFDLLLTIGDVKKKVPMTYAIDPTGKVEATGSIDLLSFGLQKAFAALHAGCEVQHKGADGISKTWTEVSVHLSAPVTTACN